eukprot:GHVQ01018228.1.p1 GENE.GHVQ01018228.1~~GHVQ01018228.1.p1  ORF type:complete len:101 (+),score=5.02 GHVQ01018228.1:197-499(+)
MEVVRKKDEYNKNIYNIYIYKNLQTLLVCKAHCLWFLWFVGRQRSGRRPQHRARVGARVPPHPTLYPSTLKVVYVLCQGHIHSHGTSNLEVTAENHNNYH